MEETKSINEQKILDLHIDLNADVLQVGHHGSSSSSGVGFIEAINPSSAVISIGINNPYGLPSPVVLERLRSQKISVLSTAVYGQVSYDFFSENYLVSRFNHDIEDYWFYKINFIK